MNDQTASTDCDSISMLVLVLVNTAGIKFTLLTCPFPFSYNMYGMLYLDATTNGYLSTVYVLHGLKALHKPRVSFSIK